MAFDAASFVNLAAGASEAAAGANEVAAGAAQVHAVLLEREYVNLMEVLAGGDSSSGVPQVALSEIERQPAAVLAASNALHDTLILAYQRAYAGEPPLVAVSESLHHCAHALVRLAICVMAECDT